MSIADKIPVYRNEINKGLSDIYPTGPSSLTKPVAYVLQGGGKRLRPLLTIFSAEACGGTKSDVFSAALAVEILHNFTLVHDDIMDQDSVRHGQKTVHQKWDDGVAILTGDAMLSLALGLLNQSPAASHLQMKIFIDGLLAVCEGQALDKEFETQTSVSLDEYIQMIDLKTGHLIGLAAELGAISTQVDSHICEKVRDYGRLVGRAFQIQDDYLEIFSNSSNMGKSLESDIVLGKKTFLMIQALEKNNDLINTALELARKDFDKGIGNIREFLYNEGIKKDTQEEVNEILKLADNKLNELPIDKEKLLYFSNLIKKRGN
ncbi:MAG: polyprenyl synthetase family protein [Candidatus Marinimicrobia bacterium]|nr:polyprenyl synthetase family protein [Candidatus Neomarinimicrobiota bacterium]